MMLKREVAKRVFALEFRESNMAFKEHDDQYAPQYLLTPTGAKCNRIFIVGTLTEKEDVGTNTEYWRARVTDPTGSFLIYAGQYQPEAAQALSSIEPPQFVAVVGKPNTYEIGGEIVTSVRPESIQIVDADTYDLWILDTARQTLQRLKRLDEGSEDVTKAKEHYSPNIGHYKQMVLDALKTLSKGAEEVSVIDLSEI
ncbi:MAG: DNA-binding protein [Methanocellales archaeon]|nr:DNA-binding protein [Methanocellales archaeon]